MPKVKSSRNKTIDFTEEEGKVYIDRCIYVKDINGVDSVVDKTIIGDTFEVLKKLPSEFVDLLVVDPPYRVSKNKEISMALVSMFQYELLKNTRCMQHWAGRGTRGVTQFYGAVIKDILTSYRTNIDINYSIDRLKEMIKL